MEVFSLVAMNAAIPELAFDLSISSVLMTLVAVVFAIAAAAVFHIRRERIERALRRRPSTYLKVVQRPAFGAAH
ncbi:MAG TPA: hypothetical protein VL403_15585 [Candidatus Kryptonia bacterium]|nr:hypothetical protein [Candidatus Kryptonia bacterium]